MALTARAASRPVKLARPRIAVDTVLLAFRQGRLQSYLVQLKTGVVAGQWAFPGGLVRHGELLDDAARRELEAATALSNAYLEQLFTFGDPSRDPVTHVVSVAYMGLTAEPDRLINQCSKYAAAQWCDVAALPPLAYDHGAVATYALNRLRGKLAYTNIAAHLLPPSFTFAELEELYAGLLEQPLDRRNFRRRVMAAGLLHPLGRMRRGAHRPAALYGFARRSVHMVEML
jgi:8-oxo-dGTP diphosphatase